jgi:hypothetical protein
MVVTPTGIVTLVRPVHPEKALPPTLVTPAGIVTLVTVVLFVNADAPITVTGNPSICAGISTAPPAPV